MYNLIYKCLGVLLLTLFFVSTSIVQASTWTEENFTGTNTIYYQAVGRSISEYSVGYAYSSTTEWAFKDVTFKAGFSWVPFDEELVGIIKNLDTWETIATSTNSINTQSTFTVWSTGYTEVTLNFDMVPITDSGNYAVILVFESGYLNNDHYLRVLSYGNTLTQSDFLPFVVYNMNSNGVPNNSFVARGTYNITLYKSDAVPFVCSGGSATLECDMASTTEAVYAVGYSINLYMGIFIALLFGYMAFIFFKKFIP